MEQYSNIIYLDNNSTTRMDDRVIEVMHPFYSIYYGNPSSSHFFGVTTKRLVEDSRSKVADFINCKEEEIVFTSGATESINLVLRGLTHEAIRKRIVTISTEHKAVLDTCKNLEKLGFEVIYLQVNNDGKIDSNLFSETINDSTLLVLVMLVNNETGVIQDVKNLCEIAHQNGCLFFCDATQAFGKMQIDVGYLNVDYLCFSGHKFHGPKGIGGLYIKKELKKSISPQLTGGSQEFGVRSGTLNTPGIVGLAEACRISKEEMKFNETNIRELRDYLQSELLKIPGTFVNGNLESRIYNTTNICFPNNDSNVIIGRLKNIALSNGSACTSSFFEPSHVLISMGLTSEEAFSAIRFSLSKYNTKSEIDEVVSAIKKVIVGNSILA